MLSILNAKDWSVVSSISNYSTPKTSYIETYQSLKTVLLNLDVDRLDIDFSGRSDEGHIDTVTAFNSGVEKDIDWETQVEALTTHSQLNDGRWEHHQQNELQSLKTALYDFAYDLIEISDIDWYNNDGGFGDLRINLDEDNFYLKVNYHFTETECGYEDTVDIHQLE